jgi:uncharacterized protein YndB with AHSA1/START domain
MENTKIVRNTAELKASPEKVWAVLTEPVYVKQYMYNCDLVTDWKVGSEVIFKLDHEGKEIVAVKGHVVENIPGRKLVYTVFDPHGNYSDNPDNYLQVTYDVVANGDHTMLVVEQGDYAKVEQGEKRYNDAVSAGGWSSVLEKVKELAEA